MLQGSQPFNRKFGTSALVIVTVIGGLACVFITLPFVSALVWSVTLAILFTPVDRAISNRIKSPSLSALTTVSIIACIVVVPAILVAGRLLSEAARSASLVAPFFDGDDWTRIVGEHRWIAPALQWIHDKIDFPDLMRTATSALATWSGSVLRASFSGAATLLLTFYLLFYFLRDRDEIREELRRHSPLSDSEFTLVSGRVHDTVFATVVGTLAVSAMQGCLGGLMFWWLGLPAPVFWGVSMGLLAVIPFLGAFVIWAPAALLLALNGSYPSALVLTVWGTLVVGLVDNVVYPILVGKRLQMHTMLSFIAIVGGLLAIGAPGVVLGPLAFALTISLVQIRWERALASRTETAPQVRVASGYGGD